MFIRYKLYGIKGLSRLEAAPTLGNKIINWWERLPAAIESHSVC
jgi:hypothetical protein